MILVFCMQPSKIINPSEVSDRVTPPARISGRARLTVASLPTSMVSRQYATPQATMEQVVTVREQPASEKRYAVIKKKPPLKISGKTILTVLIGVTGSLLLGTGLYFVTVLESMVIGILVGIAGIVVLMCLIPFIKGFK